MSEHVTMTDEQFAESLDRWGSDLERWPQPHGTAGRNRLRTSQWAREQLTLARDLDRWLASAGDHHAPPGLQQRILRGLPKQDLGQRTLDWFAAAIWRPAFAAACLLLVGFVVGIALPARDDHMMDEVSMLAFSAPDVEIDNAQQ